LDRWQALAVLSGVPASNSFALLFRLTHRLDDGPTELLWLLEQLCSFTVSFGPPSDVERVARWLAESSSRNRLRLTRAFVGSMRPHERERGISRLGGERLFQDALNACTNSATEIELRAAVLRLLSEARATNAAAAVLGLLRSGESEFLQSEAARVLVWWGEPFAAQAFAAWAELSRPVRRAMMLAALCDPTQTAALLEHVAQGRVQASEVDSTVRDRLLKHPGARLRQRAQSLLASPVSVDREAVVEKFKPALKLTGDRARGAALFERACLVCHQMQGVGARVGPDLSGVGQQPRETLLVQILDPSRQVLPDFVAYNAETTDGESYTGFLVQETAASVTLRRPNEADITLSRAQLASFGTSGKSLMPDGLEAGLTPQDMADLLEFLRRPDKRLFDR
jgi:putative heme-binding domain-containing protein